MHSFKKEDLHEALQKLTAAGYIDCTEAANEQNKSNCRYVFEHNGRPGVYYCHNVEEVLDLAEGL